LSKKKKGGDSMSKGLEDRLSDLVADREHQIQMIIQGSDDPEIRIRARVILDRNKEIAKILNLLERD
jgi:hypothetical protein